MAADHRRPVRANPTNRRELRPQYVPDHQH